MKVTVTENEGCFSIEAHAEDMVEAALLTRFGMNATREIRYLATDVSATGTFSTALVLAKAKNANSDVPNRNRKSRRSK